MNKITISCIVCISMFSCQGQGNKKEEKINSQIVRTETSTNSMENVIDLNKIKEHIELQERAFVEDHTPDNEYLPTKNDLDLQLPLLEISLTNSGYKFPEYSLFRERIQYVFGIDIDKSEENVITVYAQEPVYDRERAYTDEEMKRILKNQTNMGFEEYTYTFARYDRNLFIDKQRRIVTPMIFLEDLIKINNLKTKDYSVKQNLKIVSLNKYLIYEDRASLTYLLSRNKEFVYPLLINFNYDKEDRINEAVMDSLYRQDMEYNKGYRFGQNRLYIRKGILKTIENISSENNAIYAKSLIDNIFDTLRFMYDKTELTEKERQEKYEIVAYTANTCDPLFRKYNFSKAIKWGNGNILGSYYVYSRGDKFWDQLKEEFIKNNYYNLLNLKTMVDYAEQFTEKDAPPD